LPSSTWNVGNHRRQRLPIGTLIDPKDAQRLHRKSGLVVALFHENRNHVLIGYGSQRRRGGSSMPQRIAEESIRRSRWTGMWSEAGQLDWWVKEPQQWLGRVRGKDGRQRWIRAVDLRPAKSE
jgi:hypothetical protein